MKTKIIILLFIIFITSFSIGLLMSPINPKPKINITIPDSDMINSFCDKQGFENGWLSSSSCKVNEVMCHRKIGNLDEYKCIKWEEDDKRQ